MTNPFDRYRQHPLAHKTFPWWIRSALFWYRKDGHQLDLEQTDQFNVDSLQRERWLIDAMISHDTEYPMMFPGVRVGQVWAGKAGEMEIMSIIEGKVICAGFNSSNTPTLIRMFGEDFTLGLCLVAGPFAPWAPSTFKPNFSGED